MANPEDEKWEIHYCGEIDGFVPVDQELKLMEDFL
jgi:hypothetical protein